MRTPVKSQIRKLVIQEYYRTSLTQQLYEQAAPTPADPAAPAEAPAVDPAATATAAAPPVVDPALAASAAPAAGAAPAVPAAPAPADPLAAATPPVVDPALAASAAPADPLAAATPAATTPAATTPAAATPAATTPAAAPATTPAAPGAAPAPSAKAKPAPAKPGTAASEVEKAGIASVAAAENKVATESLRRRSLKFLMEQQESEPSIDINTYAGKLANLIKNYTSLVDVKKNVIDQAEKFLDDQFPKNSESLKKQLKDLLRKDYHISLDRPEPPSDSYAVGAKSGGGGAA